MDRRYQVFVSSTYEDLQEERREVMQALLELDCIPSGMELFPAADEDQWTLIRGVIDDCDYYLVIVGGRYGSTNAEGMSYTEMEYRYAVKTGKPIIAFLHADPGSLRARRVETDPDGLKRLEEFRELCRQKMCRNWTSSEELGSVVSRSIVKLIRRSPAVGWIRADKVPAAVSAEMLNLREQVDKLQRELLRVSTEPPKGTDELCQGDDVFEIGCSFQVNVSRDYFTDYKEFTAEVSLAWNDIFSLIAPLLINEANEEAMVGALTAKLSEAVTESYGDFKGLTVNRDDFQTLKVQLRALGLITRSERQRSVKDTATYWTLTPYGDTLMTQLRAIRRAPENES